MDDPQVSMQESEVQQAAETLAPNTGDTDRNTSTLPVPHRSRPQLLPSARSVIPTLFRFSNDSLSTLSSPGADMGNLASNSNAVNPHFRMPKYDSMFLQPRPISPVSTRHNLVSYGSHGSLSDENNGPLSSEDDYFASEELPECLKNVPNIHQAINLVAQQKSVSPQNKQDLLDEGLAEVIGDLRRKVESCTAFFPWEIENLPKIPFNKQDDSDDRCNICLSDIEEGDTLREIQCSHLFHKKCMDLWLRTNRSCPQCRKDVVTGEDQTQG